MRRAFTLIEIVMALAILGIGMIGILALYPVGFEANKRAGEVTEATILAQKKIGDLRKDGYSDLSFKSDTSDCDFDPYYEYEVIATKDTGLDLADVAVRVWWPADKGGPPPNNVNDRTQQKSVELVTQIAKYD